MISPMPLFAVLRSLNGLMRLAALIILMACGQVMAQAPTEERRHAGDPLVDAQQRVEYARNAGIVVDDRVRVASEVLKAADADMQAARRQLEQARLRQDKARKDLADAHSKASALKKDYQRESAELERIRGGQKVR